MAAHKAFNSMFDGFLEELEQKFPEEGGIRDGRRALDLAAAAKPEVPMKAFLRALEPFKEDILEGKIAEACETRTLPSIAVPGGGSVDIGALWKAADPESREAIAEYLRTLYVMGCSMALVPPQVLRSIESLAESYAERMASDPELSLKLGPGGTPTPEAISHIMGSVGFADEIQKAVAGGAAAATGPAAKD